MDDQRRISDYLRSTADLTDYFRMCQQAGDPALLEAALRDMPDWATFRDVRSALTAAGLRMVLTPLATSEAHGAPVVERRRGPRTH